MNSTPKREEEGTKNNVTEFVPKLIQGGGGKPPPPKNWLKDLSDDNVFLAKDRNNENNFMLATFEVIRNEGDYAVLDIYKSFGSEGEPFGFVDTARFCTLFDLVKVLHTQPEQEEQNNGDSDRLQGDGSKSPD